MTADIRSILLRAPVIPVSVIDDAAQAVPLARALVAGGLPVLEVTLRTAAGLVAISAMRREVPEAIVGVGTLTAPEQVAQARDAGAQFGVSPGFTAELAARCQADGWPFLPGVMTPSEAMRASAAGFSCCKLFPARQAGGVGMLNALQAVFPQLLLCPTGGITAQDAADYLALPNVACVGGSWVAPKRLMQAADWDAIRQLAAQAAALRTEAAAAG